MALSVHDLGTISETLPVQTHPVGGPFVDAEHTFSFTLNRVIPVGAYLYFAIAAPGIATITIDDGEGHVYSDSTGGLARAVITTELPLNRQIDITVTYPKDSPGACGTTTPIGLGGETLLKHQHEVGVGAFVIEGITSRYVTDTHDEGASYEAASDGDVSVFGGDDFPQRQFKTAFKSEELVYVVFNLNEQDGSVVPTHLPSTPVCDLPSPVAPYEVSSPSGDFALLWTVVGMQDIHACNSIYASYDDACRLNEITIYYKSIGSTGPVIVPGIAFATTETFRIEWHSILKLGGGAGLRLDRSRVSLLGLAYTDPDTDAMKIARFDDGSPEAIAETVTVETDSSSFANLVILDSAEWLTAYIHNNDAKFRWSDDQGKSWSVATTIATDYQAVAIEFEEESGLLIAALWKEADNRWDFVVGLISSDGNSFSFSTPATLVSEATGAGDLQRRRDGKFEFAVVKTNGDVVVLRAAFNSNGTVVSPGWS